MTENQIMDQYFNLFGDTVLVIPGAEAYALKMQQEAIKRGKPLVLLVWLDDEGPNDPTEGEFLYIIDGDPIPAGYGKDLVP